MITCQCTTSPWDRGLVWQLSFWQTLHGIRCAARKKIIVVHNHFAVRNKYAIISPAKNLYLWRKKVLSQVDLTSKLALLKILVDKFGWGVHGARMVIDTKLIFAIVLTPMYSGGGDSWSEWNDSFLARCGEKSAVRIRETKLIHTSTEDPRFTQQHNNNNRIPLVSYNLMEEFRALFVDRWVRLKRLSVG